MLNSPQPLVLSKNEPHDRELVSELSIWICQVLFKIFIAAISKENDSGGNQCLGRFGYFNEDHFPTACKSLGPLHMDLGFYNLSKTVRKKIPTALGN